MKPLLLIITGLSGPGKTIALRAVEDIGFFCADNLPPQLIEPFVSVVASKAAPRRKQVPKLAIGMDIREKHFLPASYSMIKGLRKKCRVEVVFLEAEKEILVRRFKETRRPHPLLAPGEAGMEKAIELERRLLSPFREVADRVIDTSSYTPHQLRGHITSLFGGLSGTLSLSLISFGFKFGTPQNVDLLFDVRFLPNPYFIPELKGLKGTDDAVKRFVLKQPKAGEFVKRLTGFLKFLMPLYLKEGKAYLTIGVGCTGGRHRSPVIIEKIASLLKRGALDINVVHRDI